jgi:hypothetical protein
MCDVNDAAIISPWLGAVIVVHWSLVFWINVPNGALADPVERRPG